MNIGRYWIWTS